VSLLLDNFLDDSLDLLDLSYLDSTAEREIPLVLLFDQVDMF